MQSTCKYKRDVNGILAIKLVFFGTLAGCFIPCLLVFKNLDPIFIVIYVAQNVPTFKILKIIDPRCWVLIVVRVILNSIFAQVVFVGIRTMILVSLGTYPVIITLLKTFSSVKPDKTSLQFYRQAGILYNAVKHVIKILTIRVLSCLFFVIVIGANGTILLASLGKHLLSFLCGVYTILILICVISLFNISDKIYAQSCKLLFNWEKEVFSMKSRDGLFVKKTVRSLWTMAIPMGNMGIVDKHSKNTYLEQVLNYVLNVLVMVSEA